MIVLLYLAILVFDASKPDTMDTLDNWICDLQQNNVGRQCTTSVAFP